MTTEEALEQSILHWEENLERAMSGALAAEHIKAEACALCVKFLCANGCSGCPVFEHTGFHTCMETPYDVVSAILTGDDDSDIVAAAEAELDFLKSLRKNDGC